jgi:hypothetical protein
MRRYVYACDIFERKLTTLAVPTTIDSGNQKEPETIQSHIIKSLRESTSLS